MEEFSRLSDEELDAVVGGFHMTEVIGDSNTGYVDTVWVDVPDDDPTNANAGDDSGPFVKPWPN
jgi:bacteriocin-like protein